MSERIQNSKLTDVLGLHITRSSDRRRALLGVPAGAALGGLFEGLTRVILPQGNHIVNAYLAAIVAPILTGTGLLHAEVSYGDGLRNIGVTRREARKMIRENTKNIRRARRSA